MKLNFKTMAFLALASMAFSTAAQAATSYTIGDLFLGVRKDGGSSDLIYNIGQASQFTTGASAFTVASIASSLVSVGGAGWYTDPTVKWAIFGDVKNSSSPFWMSLSQPETTFGTAGTGFTSEPNAAISPFIGEFNSLKNQYLALGTAAVTPALLISSGNADGYTSFATGAPNYDAFGGLPTANGSGSFVNPEVAFGSTQTAVDLFRSTGSNSNQAAAYNGSFTINSSGALLFSPSAPSVAAVPEPSRAVLVLGGLVAVALRRKRNA